MLEIPGATVQNVIARGLLHSRFNTSPTIYSSIVWRSLSFRFYHKNPVRISFLAHLRQWPKSVISRKTDEAHVCTLVQLGPRRTWVRIPEGSDLSLLQNVHTDPGTHRVSYSIGTGDITWREVNQSIPPSAEVKSEWSYIPTPATCLQDVGRDKFTFTFFTLLKYTHKATSHMSAICTDTVEEQWQDYVLTSQFIDSETCTKRVMARDVVNENVYYQKISRDTRVERQPPAFAALKLNSIRIWRPWQPTTRLWVAN